MGHFSLIFPSPTRTSVHTHVWIVLSFSLVFVTFLLATTLRMNPHVHCANMRSQRVKSADVFGLYLPYIQFYVINRAVFVHESLRFIMCWKQHNVYTPCANG